MTLGTSLVDLRHGQSAGRLHDIETVRIVALNTIHVTFDDGVTVRHLKFGVCLEMTSKARGRVFGRVDNKFPPAGFCVAAARSMTEFASVFVTVRGGVEPKPGMCAGWERSAVVGVAIIASPVANVTRIRNGRSNHYRARNRGAGIRKHCGNQRGNQQQARSNKISHRQFPAVAVSERAELFSHSLIGCKPSVWSKNWIPTN